MSVSFPRLRKLYAVISSDKFSSPFSLFFLLGLYNVNIISVDIVVEVP